ncbi:unnamed protein product [Natator depressus]
MASTNNAPIWLVLKWDGKTWRMTVDFRALTAVTPATAPGVAKYQEVVDAGAQWFSGIDLANAFFAIPLRPESWHKFGFTSWGQQLCFTRVPQDFHNAPAICPSHVVKMWEKLIPEAQNRVISYVDDILVHGDYREEVGRLTEQVLQIIQDTGFKASRAKARLVQQEVKYLGVILGKEGQTPAAHWVELKTSRPYSWGIVKSPFGNCKLLKRFY